MLMIIKKHNWATKTHCNDVWLIITNTLYVFSTSTESQNRCSSTLHSYQVEPIGLLLLVVILDPNLWMEVVCAQRESSGMVLLARDLLLSTGRVFVSPMARWKEDAFENHQVQSIYGNSIWQDLDTLKWNWHWSDLWMVERQRCQKSIHSIGRNK